MLKATLSVGAIALAGAIAVGCKSNPETAEATPTATNATFADSPRCFIPTDVTNWTTPQQGQLILRTRQGAYSSTIGAGCFNIDWSEQIAIQPTQPGRQICTGDDARILTREFAGESSACTAVNMRPLSGAQIAALPERSR